MKQGSVWAWVPKDKLDRKPNVMLIDLIGFKDWTTTP